MLPVRFLEYVQRAGGGWSGDLLIADCDDFENLSESEVHVKRFQKESCRFHVPPDLSNSSIFLNSHAAKCPPGENSEEHEKEEEDTLLHRENGKDFWSMSGYFMYPYHEVHRTELNIPDETTVSILLKYVDVMRQTRTSIESVSKQSLNEYWNDEKEVLLSEEWIGTTRFQMLRTKLPKGCTWVLSIPMMSHPQKSKHDTM